MEANSVRPEAPGLSTGWRDSVRTWLNKYGLILILLSYPAYYGIQDLKNTSSLTPLANNIFAGLSNGMIIALIAIGYTLVYGIIELINFAHGDVFMIGSFTASQFWGAVLGVTLASSTAGII